MDLIQRIEEKLNSRLEEQKVFAELIDVSTITDEFHPSSPVSWADAHYFLDFSKEFPAGREDLETLNKHQDIAFVLLRVKEVGKEKFSVPAIFFKDDFDLNVVVNSNGFKGQMDSVLYSLGMNMSIFSRIGTMTFFESDIVKNERYTRYYDALRYIVYNENMPNEDVSTLFGFLD